MKRLLIVIVIILMIDQVLTPFSYVFSNEDEIFDMQENVVIENEVGTESSEDIQDSTLENQNEEENTEDTTYDSTSSDNEIGENNQTEITDEETGEEENNLHIGDDNELNDGNTTGDETEENNTSESSTIVILLAEKLGINWEEDAKYYAELAGIDKSEYEGTREQNEQIRLFLIEHEQEVTDGEFDEIIEQKKTEDEETPDYSEYTKETRVAVLAEKLGINWEEDAKYYAELVGIERGEYEGTKEQNEQIRLFFLDNLEEILNGEYEETITEMKTENQEGLTGDEAEFEIEVETGSTLTGEIFTGNISTGDVITGDIELVDTGCLDNYHEENGLCEPNTKTVRCEQKGGVENSAYIETGVTVTWDIIGGIRNETPACEWKCLDNYHKIGGVCDPNTKIKDCTQTGGVENSIYIVTGVTITWNITGGVRNQTSACEWKCKPHYHQSENTCNIDTFMFTLVENHNVKISGSTQSGKKPYEAKIGLEAYVDTGYRFMGWQIVNLQASGSSMTTVDNQVVFNMPDRDVTATPLSEVIEYKIVYRNIDDAVMNNPDTYTIETPTFSLKEPTKTGYTFLGWTGSNGLEPEKQITLAKGNYGNKKYTAVWQPNLGIEYQVVHATEKANSTSYEIRETEILTGTTDELTQAVAKSYTGFTAKEITQKIIKGDGSTAVRVQYQRNIYTISFDSNGGSEVSHITGKYESDLIAPSDPIKSGYIFTGWKPNFPSTMPLSGAELVAQWKQELEVNNIENELITARETLNNKKIKGKETYNNVTVKVEAPKHSFPEGTELRIIPITGNEQKQTIKEKLIKNTDVTEESELVSFDISFIYTLSGGNEVELQPYTGQTVKVSFNYKNNNKFNKSKNDKNKDLKVYHFEKVKNKKNKKSEEIAIKEIKVNESESSDGELVVDAEKFSVYTIVTQLYEETNNTRTWRLHQEYEEIEIPNTQNTICYTIMDRNLGATQVGNNWKKHNNEAGGYYYQYGNNYGFTLNYAQSNYTDIIPDTSLVSNSNYVNKTWVKNNERTSNLNIWGGGSDSVSNEFMPIVTNFEERQGPCPDGWHVPSAGEWGKAFYYRGSKNGYSITQSQNAYYTTTSYKTTEKAFIQFLKIDPAGEISNLYNSISLYNTNTRAIFWTSSPYSDNERLLEMRLYTNGNSAGGIYDNNRGQPGLGLPIRCFKNTYECKNSSNCTLDDGVVVHNGDTLTVYQAPIVAQGLSCQSQQVTCNNGTLNGSYRYSTCEVYGQSGDAQVCTLPRGGTIEHNQSITGYQSATVPYGQSCVSETRTCNNGTLSGSFEYSGCSIAEPATCSFQGQTIAHNGSLTVYSNASPICPTACTAGTVTCNNGTLGGDTSYTNLSCTTVSKTCDASFSLSSTGAHGTYSSCTPYTSNGNGCAPGTTKYKLTNCANGYHTENNSTCVSNSKQVACAQNGKPANSSYVAGNVTVTWQGTWNSGNWSATGSCAWICDPHYHTGANNNSCEIDQYTATITATPSGYGSVSLSSVKKDYNSNIVVDGNKVTIGGTEVTATPTSASQEFTYTFSGWNNTCGGTLTKDCTITAQFERTTNKYLITFNNRDGTTLQTGMIEYGDIPSYTGTTPSKAADAQYTYTFAGWSPTITGVTETATYTAIYNTTTNQYTATIGVSPSGYGSVNSGSVKKNYGALITINEDKITIGGTEVTATPTSASQEFTYTFSGWNNTCGGNLTANCTIIAEFKKITNQYTITFYDEDGTTELGSSTVNYGTDATYGGTTPTKAATQQYTYEFDDWYTSPEGGSVDDLSDVTADRNVYARYSFVVNPYTATITATPSEYGTVSSDSVTKNYSSTITENGNKITIGGTEVTATPTEDTSEWDYEFVNWTNNCNDTLTENCTITANFTRTKKSYLITFKNWDGEILQTGMVEYGTTPTYNGATPTKAVDAQYTYTFVGWSPEIYPVNETETYTAQFSDTTNKYDVTFDSNGGTPTPSTQNIAYGSKATKPSDPTKIGYTFGGWTLNGNDFDFNTGITGTTNLVAMWNLVDYTITYNLNGGTNNANNPSTYTIESGDIILQSPTKTGYTFLGWTGSNGDIPQTGVIIPAGSYGNKTYNATWQVNTYNISYTMNGGTQGTNHPTSATYDTPFTVDNPTKVGYTFSGWKITGMDAGVTHYYGNQTTTSTNISSTTATGFNNLTSVSGDIVKFEALWDINEYNVTIEVNEEGWGFLEEDISGKYDYGTPVEALQQNDYGLVKFGNGICVHHGGSNKAIVNQFDWCIYTKAWPIDGDTQYTYTFSGWNNECGDTVTHDCTIVAEFNRTLNSYDVTFDSNGGTPVATQNIYYGSKATKPVDPIRTGYAFAGWRLNGSDFDFNTEIIGTINLVAEWNLVDYTITYNLNGGTETAANPTTYTVESGAITLHQPTKVGYTFLGWTGSNGSAPQTGVTIPAGSYGDKTYNAVWTADSNTQYIVYHYVKRVGQNTYELSDTETKYGTTDETLTISSLAKENVFTCAHYDRGSLTGTEFGPGEVVTQTTIRGDGTTKIYLFYVRDYYNVYLTGDEHIDILKINGVETEHAVLECGSEVPVGAVPKPGYHFVRWEEREVREENEGEDDTSGE